jgi:hypothetical protein
MTTNINLSNDNDDSEKIFVFDNFLTSDELEECEKIVMRASWSFGHVSTHSSPITTPFWTMSLTDEPFFNTHIFSKIQNSSKKKFKINFIYANGQTFGQDGTYHRDADTKNDYTFCIYLNKQVTTETIDNVGGEFVFKVNKCNNHIVTLSNSSNVVENSVSRVIIEPYYNRGIMFNGTLYHKGMAFNRYSRSLRISIAFKLVKISDE